MNTNPNYAPGTEIRREQYQTRTERQKEARELRAKLNIARPDRMNLPSGRMPVVREQYAANLIGPVYNAKGFEKFLKEMTKKGRQIPDFYQIQNGKNAGCYREINANQPVKKILHY
jgi:hypothetical protein